MIRQTQRLGRLLAAFALCGMVCPSLALAGDPSAVNVSSTVLDVKLDADNLLHGTAMTAAGNVQAGALVTLAQGNQSLATAQANHEGRFAFRLAKGGVYQLAVGERVVLCRVWSERLAPPAAKQQLLVVTDTQLARGQRPLGEVLFSTPVLIGVVIAAAVAIPLAIDSSDDDSTPSMSDDTTSDNFSAS
jgi:hypothetical protein